MIVTAEIGKIGKIGLYPMRKSLFLGGYGAIMGLRMAKEESNGQ